MKLLIISEDAGAKIARGRGTGNYYIISDGLRVKSNLSKGCARNLGVWGDRLPLFNQI